MHVVNVSGLKNNPSEALRSAKDGIVVVMNRGRPDAVIVGLQSGKLLSEPGARGACHCAVSQRRPVAGAQRPYGANAARDVHRACLATRHCGGEP